MKFSIIMATMNAEALLQRGLVSILKQDCPNYEIIVQDGGSTDGTLDILKRFKRGVSWVSEPDAGVYEAWNKALDRATGDWAIFLGADDFLLNNEVLSRCESILKDLPSGISFAYGALCRGGGGRTAMIISRPLSVVYHMFFNSLGLPFPATFIRVPVLREYRFDAGFRIAGDFDFAARALTASNVARLPLPVAYMEEGGLSDNAGQRRTLNEERLRVLRTRIRPKAGELLAALADAMEKEFAAMDAV